MTGGSLAGRSIGITRPEEGALGARLRALAAEVVHVPLIAIAEPDDGGAELREALDNLDAFDWLVVTSANGARRVGRAAGIHHHVRLAAVGPATAGALAAAAGRPVDLVASVPRAEGLLAEFPAPRAHVLLAQADRARSVLADGLAAAGHDVESVIAYRTVVRRPTPAEVARLATVDVVVLASGTAAEGYVEALGVATRAVLVAIGPTTAEAARAHGLAVAHVATSPDADSLVQLLQTALTPSV